MKKKVVLEGRCLNETENNCVDEGFERRVLLRERERERKRKRNG